MDADELFARQLQEEEDRASVVELMRAESAASSSSQRTEFAKRLDGGYRTVLAYGKPEARAVALAVIPLARLEREADELVARTAGKASEVGTTSGDDGTSGDEASSSSEKTVPISRADAVLRRLLWWFKDEFFTWCDAPVCVACGTAKPTPIGTGQPTVDESKHGASRIELFRCVAETCGREVRFPRFNDPVKLLSTKTGRCGEWANAFTLLCVSLGYEARWVLDWTDHVWTEVWSVHQNKWLHCDSCENVCDEPLLYEKGWGKKLSFVVAFGVDNVCDVTRRYIIDHKGNETRRRALLSGPGDEQWLVETIATARSVSRRMCSPARAKVLATRDAREASELSGTAIVDATGIREETSLKGRTTGSVQWRAARGELGDLADAEKLALRVKEALQETKADLEKQLLPKGDKETTNLTTSAALAKPNREGKTDRVAEAVRLEFTRLTATDRGMSPNEAAAKALSTVRRALRVKGKTGCTGIRSDRSSVSN